MIFDIDRTASNYYKKQIVGCGIVAFNSAFGCFAESDQLGNCTLWSMWIVEVIPTLQ